MTEAQIRYRQYGETKRHNIEQERYWSDQVEETRRTNRANEELKRYSTDTSWRQAQLQANTSRYATDTSWKIAQLQAQTSRYAADTSAAASRFVGAERADATRYSADVSAETSRYRTDTDAAIAQARLDFDKATQSFKNRMEERRVTLQAYETYAHVDLSRAQIEKMAADTSRDLQQLELAAEELGMKQKAQKYQNLLTIMQSIQAGTQASRNTAAAAKDLLSVVTDAIALGGM
jgi:hypothetical protein